MTYDALQAGAYDASYGQHPSITRTIRAAALGPDDVVLDVGCGSGWSIELAVARGARVIGVDPSEAMLDLARARCADRLACLMRGTCSELPLADVSVTVVLLINVVHHLEDLDESLRECRRVLRPRGRLIVSWERAEGMPGPEDVARVARASGFQSARWEGSEGDMWLVRASVAG